MGILMNPSSRTSPTPTMTSKHGASISKSTRAKGHFTLDWNLRCIHVLLQYVVGLVISLNWYVILAQYCSDHATLREHSKVIKANNNISMTHKAFNGRVLCASFADVSRCALEGKSPQGLNRVFGRWLGDLAVAPARVADPKLPLQAAVMCLGGLNLLQYV